MVFQEVSCLNLLPLDMENVAHARILLCAGVWWGSKEKHVIKMGKTVVKTQVGTASLKLN